MKNIYNRVISMGVLYIFLRIFKGIYFIIFYWCGMYGFNINNQVRKRKDF